MGIIPRASVVALGWTALLCGVCYGQQRSVAIKNSAFGALTGPVESFGINSRAVPTAPTVAEEDFLIPFEGSNRRLFLRHLPPASGMENPARSVLFIHGITFPSALAAAFPFGGHSWMQDLSAANFDVWALDFMGYGGSDRYPENSGDKAVGAAPLRVAEASRQIEAAGRFIIQNRHVGRISVIAHSWGTLPTGLFATQHPDLLDRLVLFGPLALRHQSPEYLPADKAPRAWNVTIDEQRKRFYGYVPSGERPVLSESDMKVWERAYLASDPGSADRTPPSVRVPYGPLLDFDLAWSGIFPYDPERISAATLIIRGEWDSVTKNDDARWLYSHLRNAPIKRDVVISRGTHVMHLEESRVQLYREVQIFLESNDTVPSPAG